MSNLIAMFFSRTMVFGFLVSASWPQARILNAIRKLLIAHNICATVAPSCLSGSSLLDVEGIVSGLMVSFLPRVFTITFSSMNNNQ